MIVYPSEILAAPMFSVGDRVLVPNRWHCEKTRNAVPAMRMWWSTDYEEAVVVKVFSGHDIGGDESLPYYEVDIRGVRLRVPHHIVFFYDSK